LEPLKTFSALPQQPRQVAAKLFCVRISLDPLSQGVCPIPSSTSTGKALEDLGILFLGLAGYSAGVEAASAAASAAAETPVGIAVANAAKIVVDAIRANPRQALCNVLIIGTLGHSPAIDPKATGDLPDSGPAYEQLARSQPEDTSEKCL
jgi:hypothetical protein